MFEIHTTEGMITDSIEFSRNGGPREALDNNKTGWAMVHLWSKYYKVTVVFTRRDGSQTHTPWLQSAPFKHRQHWLQELYTAA